MLIKANKEEDILKEATGDMVKGLNAFGHDEILKLLVLFSNRDEILGKLLLKFPSIVTTNRFVYRMPVMKIPMSQENFRNLMKAGFPIWIREQKREQEGHIRKNVLKKPKRTRSRRQNLATT